MAEGCRNVRGEYCVLSGKKCAEQVKKLCPEFRSLLRDAARDSRRTPSERRLLDRRPGIES